MKESLSVTCSKLMRLARDLDFADEEIRQRHAPSECFDLVVKNTDKEAAQIISDAGWDIPADFWKEVESRVSGKWLYYSGLLAFRDVYEENRDLWED